jgi:hypothetical protein
MASKPPQHGKPAAGKKAAPPAKKAPTRPPAHPQPPKKRPAAPATKTGAAPEITFISDVKEVSLLVSSLQRHPTTVPAQGELAASLVGGVSANKPLAQASAALLELERQRLPLSDPAYAALIANWRRFYIASRSNWMGDEFFSCIYSSIHLLSNIAVVAWSSRNGGQLEEARQWIAVWWQLADRMATPQGYIAGIGERSGGHATDGRDRAILSWLYALAGGHGSDVSRAEGWCKAGGAGLRPHGDPLTGSWEYPAVQELLPVLAATYAERESFPLSGIRFEQPLQGVRTAGGDFAYWLARGHNSNTPPVLAVVYLRSRGDGPDAPLYLPDKGGPHFRESASGSACGRIGDALVLTSVKQGHGTLALPVGGVPEVIGA